MDQKTKRKKIRNNFFNKEIQLKIQQIMSRFTKNTFLFIFFLLHLSTLLVSILLIFNAVLETYDYSELFEYSHKLYLSLILLMPIFTVLSLFTWGVLNERKGLKFTGTIISGIMSVLFFILFVLSISFAYKYDIQWDSEEINQKRIEIEKEVCFYFILKTFYC